MVDELTPETQLNLADTVSDLLTGAGKKAEDLINKIPGGPASADPSIASETNPKVALEKALALMGEVLKDQGKQALADLKLASEKAAQTGVKILTSMTALGIQVAQKKIDAESASVAINNYLEALKLVGMAEVNVAKAEAYKRALKTLQTVKSVLLALLQVALNVAIPGASAWVSGLNLGALLAPPSPAQ